MVYKFKKDFRAKNTSGLDAQAVGAELETLRQQNNGRLDKQQVVDTAKSKQSPLHNAFTWDNEKAANHWRLEEARYLINSVVVIIENDSEESEELPAFVAIKNPETKHFTKASHYYQSVAVIKESPDEWSAALRSALADLSGAEITVNRLKRLAPKEKHESVTTAHRHVLAAHQFLNQTV